ncbi:MAG: malto-oligosyltrehalose synthase [Gammaproteobacteria bacterium]
MFSQTALDRLALIYGIQLHYTDIWGKRYDVSTETKQALLAAMGVTADSEETQLAALKAYESQHWCRLLPPVQVEQDGHREASIPITIDQALAERTFSWQLTTERGSVHSGTFEPSALALVAQHEIDGKRFLRLSFSLPVPTGQGYHRFEISTDGGPAAAMTLIRAPARCYTPVALEGDNRLWGVVAQLYGVRSSRNWGIGDFTDLRLLIDTCAEAGAEFVGLNPVHTLFLPNPARRAPYSPSSRLFLNLLYLDVEAMPDFLESTSATEAVQSGEFQQRLQVLRESELVDYAAVTALKLPILRSLYRMFRERHLQPQTERGRAFLAFQAAGKKRLQLYALFEALQAHFQQKNPGINDWRDWPEAYRTPSSAETLAFAEENREQVEFYQYLQWQADRQLDIAGKRALTHRLGIGLMQDLALGCDAGGADVWMNQDLYAQGVSIGAPPDSFNLKGQDWGLPPAIPQFLKEMAYAPYIATLRRNMQHAGALRIDHVMNLMRLYWVPEECDPTSGAYVHYPLEDLLGILALESQRHHCLIIGEDLGTVPAALRPALKPAGVLGYRVLFFEKEENGAFIAPGDYSSEATVAISTHDLPTLDGYWEGRDIALRDALSLLPSAELYDQLTQERRHERARLLAALAQAGLCPEDVDTGPAATPEMTPQLSLAIHQYVARTPAKLMAVQLENAVGMKEQVNLPGAGEEYPNWQHKLTVSLEDLGRQSQFKALAVALTQERGLTGWRTRGQDMASNHVAIPRATYRLQFNAGFTFRDAMQLIPYLDALGISHCYASPYLKARSGSLHGYDIIDHSSLNPEIGSRKDFDEFVDTLRAHNMGHILDMVPNHMGVMGSDNLWWLDVLENGPASYYAAYFDIDWNPIQTALRNKLLIPVLGDQYGYVLERGELVLAFDEEHGGFNVHYYEHLFPIDPREYPRILEYAGERLKLLVDPKEPWLQEFQSLIAAFAHLPAREETAVEKLEERHRDKEIHKQRLAVLCASQPELQEFIRENVREFNFQAENPDSTQRLHELLETQAYRLTYWRVASDEINYRRFFDINDLAALKMEREAVFQATHRLVLQLIAQGRLDGLRIDHADGLYNPREYYRRLQVGANLGAIHSPHGSSIYIVAEKILAVYEQPREDWLIHGTSGYEFTNLVNGLYVERSAQQAIEEIYWRFIEEKMPFDELLYDRKKLIIDTSLAAELNVLANQLNQISELDPKTRDFTLNGLRHALSEIIACFPVYRTYIENSEVADEDRRFIEWAVVQGKKRSTAADTTGFDFVRDVLLLEAAHGKAEAYAQAISDFVMHFQQYTAPVMAKGLEDTALYAYHALTSLNEVGGDPRRFGVSVGAFHQANQRRLRDWPYTLLSTSTHDSKRSEDVRARIDVLSELPEEWEAQVTQWNRINQSLKRKLDVDLWAPSLNDEYLFYQTLIGTWPLEELDDEGLGAFRDRIQAYMLKAVREAKVHTSWISSNAEYEEALATFIDDCLITRKKNLFLEAFLPFQKHLCRFGLFNSLSQTLIKLTAPGVPDIYQGNELWMFTLVDPDNRQPVDFARRQALLEELKGYMVEAEHGLAQRVRSLLDNLEDGRSKLYLNWRALDVRRRYPDLFRYGRYNALTCEGNRADNLCAYARSYGGRTLVVIAPRNFVSLTDKGVSNPVGAVWNDTQIQVPSNTDTHYVNLLTEECVTAQERENDQWLSAEAALLNFPVALLMNQSALANEN